MMIYTIDELILLFFIYSFIGYLWEVVLVLILNKKIINRGFLYGPIIPIYGCGALVILFSSSSLNNNLMIFICGMISASILEYVTGFLMYKIFNIRYWDYSGEIGNINGFVCLKASLVWGVFSLLLIRCIQPLINGFLFNLDYQKVKYIFYILIFIFATDVTVSVKNALDLKNIINTLKKEKIFDDISDAIDAIPGHLKDISLEAKNKISKFIDKHPTAVFDKKILEIIKRIHNL